MPTTINGSPTHVLVVHAVVVLLPVAVVAALLLVAVPATRRAYALLGLLVAFVACVAVPVASTTGEGLEHRLGAGGLIRRHAELAHQLTPLAAVFGLAFFDFVALDFLDRARRDNLNVVEQRLAAGPIGAVVSRRRGRSVATRIAAAVLVVLAVATGVQVYRVGDAGAKAAWSGRV